MTEIWLQSNRRAAVAPSLALIPFAAGAAVSSYESFRLGHPAWVWLLALVAAILFVAISAYLWILLNRPRIALSDGQVLLNVDTKRPPIAVPLEYVEAFLLGKGPTFLNGKDDYKTETSTLIVKLSEAVEEFAKLETNVRIAAWCGHYVTFRGTWTEPLSIDVVNRLNQRLYEVQQAQPSSTVTS